MSTTDRPKILVTNDDGRDSPLLRFAIDVLKERGDLTIVVPKEEQSWTSKSITRFGSLHLEPMSLDGGRAYCLDGTPSDCANLGIYHLYEDKPDLVVSGINLGLNAGLGAFLASGTVGACLEANIAGLPAVALSQELERGAFRAWAKKRAFPEETLARLRAQIPGQLEAVFARLFREADFRKRPVMWNVNMPDRAAADCEVVVTSLASNRYGSCFKADGRRFYHEVDFFMAGGEAHTDVDAVSRGHVSITPVDVRELGRRGRSS